MVFTSTIFLFAFLPLAIGAFYVVPARWRAAPLLLMSAVFYAWGEPILVVLILLTGMFTYGWGKLLIQTEPAGARRALLVVGIVVDLVPAWTFVVWGLYFGVVIGLERSVYGARLDRAPAVVRHGYGLLIALLGWVIFRSRSLHQAGEYYRAMAGFGARGWDVSTTYAVQEACVLALVGAVLAAGAARPFMDRVERTLAGVWEGLGVAAPLDTATEAEMSVSTGRRTEHDPAGVGLVLAATGVTAALLGLATAFAIAVNYSPFIYFRF